MCILETVDDMKNKVLLGESSLKIISEQNESYVTQFEVLKSDIAQAEIKFNDEQVSFYYLKYEFYKAL